MVFKAKGGGDKGEEGDNTAKLGAAHPFSSRRGGVLYENSNGVIVCRIGAEMRKL